MSLHFGCDIPEDLYYHPEYDSWVRFEEDGTATLGMTDLAQTTAGKLIFVRFKAEGRHVKKGGSAATIESGKWVGPFRIPFESEIVATNESAFLRDILIGNRDPYGKGWLVRVRPLKPEDARDELLAGDSAVTFMKRKIEKNDVRCFRCLDEPVPMRR